MITVNYKFSISYDSKNDPRPSSGMIFAGAAEDVDWFGRISDLEVITRESKIYGMTKLLKVDCDEKSPKLAALFEAIEQKYGFKVYEKRYVPIALRDTHFGVTRLRQFSEDEIESSELLWLRIDKAIAKHKPRTPEQITEESYVVERQRGTKRTRFGILAPFSALAVSGELKAQMEASGLAGLNVSEKVINADDLWKLSSTVILPRCKVPLVNEEGILRKNPETWEKFEWRFFDDGYDPPILSYDRGEIENLKPFDIAVTAERTGQSNSGAYRQCIVSQKFRQALNELKVPGVQYVPVRSVGIAALIRDQPTT